MIEVKAPAPFPALNGRGVFLAGSIEMGAAINWQERLKTLLNDMDIVLLNPRRDDWDSTWVQHKDNPPFREQVLWELEGLERATVIVLYFDPTTKSPISLLEFGLYALSEKLIVCCPPGFWRKGNVDLICTRYHVMTADTLEAIPTLLRLALAGTATVLRMLEREKVCHPLAPKIV